MTTHETARRFLQALQRDIDAALSLTADGRYDEAAESLKCGGHDIANIVEALEELAAVPRCGCRDTCSDCAPLDASEYA